MPNLIEALEKLVELQTLPEGWDYGRGGPATRATIKSCLALISKISKLGAESFDVIPGDERGAVIFAYWKGHSAEIYCRDDMRYDLLHENAHGEEEFFAALSLTGLMFRLGEFGWQSPRFYGSCIRNGMFQESGDIVALPLGTLQGAVYLSSAQSVSPTEMWSRALTYGNFTMPKFAESRQSSGVFKSIPYQKALA